LSDLPVVLEQWDCTSHNGADVVNALVKTLVSGRFAQYTVTCLAHGVWVQQWLNPQAVFVEDETLLGAAALAEGVFTPVVASPMNGKITQVLVEPGQRVEAGSVLVCLEAMKMEHRIAAKTEAIVEQVHVKVGDQMKLKQVMIQLSQIQSANVHETS
jgi:acetyl/propionyl-CoA carboxylase alpha subunit